MKFIRILMLLSAALLFVSPYTHAQSSPLVNLQQVSCDVGLVNPQGQGCCSWHGGECGCSNGRDVCCYGSYSPTRGCHSAGLQLADEYVHGYTRSDGTYVQGYMRSPPDSNPYNNYSVPGNTNPYTGKFDPGNPDTYLRDYYNRNSGSSVDSGSGDSDSDSDSGSDGDDN
ncbi:MAG: hypothetical protein ABSC63_19935 [Candidatus Binataceae bacterium]|jgi:hypothetical protein